MSSPLLSRYVENIGAPEQVTFGSTQGAVTGCVGTKQYNQSGGAYVSPVFDDSIPMGPHGGVRLGAEGVSSCGMNSDLNMGASKQHSYLPQMAQKGGSGGNNGSILQGNIRYGFVDPQGEHLGAFRGSYAPPTASTVQTCYLSPATSSSSSSPSAQVGGARGNYSKYLSLCSMKKLRSITSYGQVREFWNKICPGATSLYENFVMGRERQSKQTQDNVRKFLQYYTKAFCHEALASHSNDKEFVRKQLRELESAFRMAGTYLKKIISQPSSNKLHDNIVKLHKNRVILYMQRARPSLKSSKQTHKHSVRKSRKSRKHSSRKLKSKSHIRSKHKNHSRKSKSASRSRKHRSSRHSRRQRGGYHQFNSNTPISYGQQIVPSGSSNLNSPPSFMRTNTCVDNYNHYTGKGFETPVLDGDVV
jgi:hypothetical protein